MAIRADFANGGGDKALPPRRSHQRLFPQEVSAEVGVQVSQDRVVLYKGRYRAGALAEIAARKYRVAGIDRVAEISGVSQVMAGGDGRGIGRGERGKQGVAVYKAHALGRDPVQRGRVGRIHGVVTQAVGYENHDVAGRGGWGNGLRLARGQESRQQEICRKGSGHRDSQDGHSGECRQRGVSSFHWLARDKWRHSTPSPTT